MSGTHSANVTYLRLSSPVGVRASATASLTGPLVALNALANFLGALLTCVEIGFDLLPMTHVVGNDSINICQCRGGGSVAMAQNSSQSLSILLFSVPVLMQLPLLLFHPGWSQPFV